MAERGRRDVEGSTLGEALSGGTTVMEGKRAGEGRERRARSCDGAAAGLETRQPQASLALGSGESSRRPRAVWRGVAVHVGAPSAIAGGVNAHADVLAVAHRDERKLSAGDGFGVGAESGVNAAPVVVGQEGAVAIHHPQASAIHWAFDA